MKARFLRQISSSRTQALQLIFIYLGLESALHLLCKLKVQSV
ncbi:hypothetical protein [Helicobacter labetoulli]|nr:hypothetical protein [Helicobacter labetoulli]